MSFYKTPLFLAFTAILVFAQKGDLTSASNSNANSHWVLGGIPTNFNESPLRTYLLTEEKVTIVTKIQIPLGKVSFQNNTFTFENPSSLQVFSVQGKLLFQSKTALSNWSVLTIPKATQRFFLKTQDLHGNIQTQTWTLTQEK